MISQFTQSVYVYKKIYSKLLYMTNSGGGPLHEKSITICVILLHNIPIYYDL